MGCVLHRIITFTFSSTYCMHYIVISILLINKRLKSIYKLIRNLTENISSPSGMSLTLKGRNLKWSKIGVTQIENNDF